MWIVEKCCCSLNCRCLFRSTELEKHREASAAAVARSEALAASLESSASEGADVNSAVDTLRKEEELVKLKEGMHDAMVRSVGEQCELAVSSAMTTFEETHLAPKLAGLTKDLRQSLSENAAAVGRTENLLQERILVVQASAKESLLTTEAKLTDMVNQLGTKGENLDGRAK